MNKTFYRTAGAVLALVLALLLPLGAWATAYHTITIDGTNDFDTSTEQFVTTSGTTLYAYATWDDDYLYFGFSGSTPAGSVTEGNRVYHIYLDVDPQATPTSGNGTTDGETWRWDPTLPFNADYHYVFKTQDNSEYKRSYGGSAWGDATIATSNWKGASFWELRMARADLGDPAAIYTVMYVEEDWDGGFISGGAPGNLFTNTSTQGGIAFNAHWLGFVLSSGIAPNHAANADCHPALTVTSAADSGAGSLRQAIADTCVGGSVTFNDTLAGQTLTFTEQITLTQDLTIDGSSLSAPIVLNGNGVTRLFKVTNNARVTLAHLTLTRGHDAGAECWGVACGGALKIENGASLTLTHSSLLSNTVSDGSGGAIYNAGRLAILDSRLTDNRADVADWGEGGGIYNDEGAVYLTRSRLTANQATTGGALYNYYGVVELAHSTLSGNRAWDGAGLFNDWGALTITHSTIADNVAGGKGGGLWGAGNSVTLLHSTLSGNRAGTHGGGLYFYSGALTLTHSTLTGNVADDDNDNWMSDGGGIYCHENGVVTLRNSLVAGNLDRSTPGYADCYGALVSADYNLTGAGTGCALGGAHDQTTTDPGLAALADNGGETHTHALLPGSPAVDAIPFGVNGCGAESPQDQRGALRPFPMAGACDIGAYEAPQSVLHLPLNEAPGATTFADASGNGYPGACSGATCPTAGADGKLDRAAQFDGVDDVITVADAPTLTTFSLSLWFWWDDLDSDEIDFLTGKGLGNMELHTGGDTGVNGLRFIPAGYPATHVDATGVITAGWNHVAASYDGSAAHLYVNGALAGSRVGITGGSDLSADTAPLRLGRRADATYPFAGRMDDVRLYHRVLSAAEIAALAAARPALVITPAQLDFGLWPIAAGPTPAQTVYIGNTGLGDLHLSSVTLSGDTASFSLQDSGHLTLTPGATRALTVTFDPAGPGRQALTVTIASDDPDESLTTALASGLGRASHITVTTAADENDGFCGAACSLREALALLLPGGVIGFDVSLAGQTITLTRGQLEITRSMTLDGSSLNAPLVIDGNQATRLFKVGDGVHVTFAHLTLMRGTDSSGDTCWNEPCGGAIRMAATANVTLTHSAILSSTAPGGYGGGILNPGGVLTVLYSEFSGNQAGRGGGIYSSDGNLILADSRFTANQAPATAAFSPVGGAAVCNYEGHLDIARSQFTDNVAGHAGGGLYNYGASSVLTITDSSFSGNSAGWWGGGLYIFPGVTTIQRSALISNTAGSRGGGIDCDNLGRLDVLNSTFSGNRTDGDGGGIRNGLCTLNVTQSTFTGNLADADNNGAGDGGGLYNDTDFPRPFTLHNSLVAGNEDRSTPGYADCRGTITSQGYNLVGTGTGCPVGANDRATATPGLTALDNHGGETWTHALLPASPAIDAGDPLTCPATDQRGFPRNDLRCDIGAFELQHADSATVIKTGLTPDVPYTFGPTQVRMTLTNAATGAISVTKNLTYPGGIYDTGEVQATWWITGDLIAGFPITLSLCYTDDEVAGLSENDLDIFRWVSGQWVRQNATPDPVNNCVTLTGVQSFSAWTLFDTSNTPEKPTAIGLQGFAAGARGRALLLAGPLLTGAAVIVTLRRRRR